MATHLQESYAALERKLAQQTDELNEALQQQVATAEVLKVISRSAFDLQSVLDTLTVSAARLCRADMAGITRPIGDDHYYATNHNFPPDWLALMKDIPLRRDRGSIVGRVLLDGQVVQVADVLSDPEFMYSELARKAGYQTFLGVPLLRDGGAIGVLVVARKTVEPFSPRQIELLITFADQAVIAIENVRLFEEAQARNREVSEALEQQTATADILRVISSSPTDIQPVFDTIAESAARLCEAQFCFVARFDGTLVHFVAHHGLPVEAVEVLNRAYPMPPGRGSAAARAILSGAVEHIRDVQADPDYMLGAITEVTTVRSIVAVPVLRDRRPIGAIAAGRSQAGYFPDRQIELLKTFADQAVIAIENVRLFTELDVRNRELNEALQQQTATADVLKVISRSTFDLQAVLDTLVKSAVRLCEAYDAAIVLEDGGWLTFSAHHGPIPIDFDRWPATRGWTAGRAVVDRKPVHVQDLHTAGNEFPDGREMALRLGHRTTLSVPLLRGEEALGALTIRRLEVRPFTDKQIELLATFADQAVIAIENVRLFDQVHARTRELTEALEQQTATSEILRVISMSPSSVQPVFETIVRNAVALCGSLFANVFRFDGELLHFVASHNVGPDYIELLQSKYPMRPDATQLAGRVLLERSVVRLEDALSDAEYDHRFPLAMGWRRLLGVPMLREGEAIGVIVVGWAEAGPVSQRQEDLLKTFADQAVIAVENVRLFDEVQARTRELSEALEQQTATTEVLGVISSSPGELEPVFQAMLANATRICQANLGTMYYYQDDAFHLAGWLGASPALAELYSQRGSFQPSAGTPLDRLLRTKDVIHIADDAAELNPGAAARLGGARSTIAVPMLKDAELVGAIVIYRQEVRPFTDKQIDLVTSFANQAVIAIENVRLLKELRERTRELAQSVEELRALGEVSQAVNSTLDLETVLNTIVAKAVQLSGTDAGAIYVLNKSHTKFKLRATYGMDEATVAAIRHSSIRPGETAIGQATEQRRPIQIADVLQAPAAGVLDVVVQAGYRSILIVPLLGPERAIGVLVIRRKVPGGFPDSTVDLLQTFAAQSVLAIQNARLFHEIEEKSQQLEIASRHKSQFLANMSHELRTPLNAILGYSELVLDDIYGAVPDKARVALERVESNGKHLLGLINDVLDLAKIEAGRLTLSLADYSLNEVVASVVASVEALAAEKQLALRVDVPGGLPIGHGDEQRIRQVLLNLVSNAIKFTDAGEVAIRVSVSNGDFNISVSDTGPGISAEDQAKLFQDFHQADSSSTRKKGGTGLGLAISRRFVDLQGGRIWVESAPGRGSTFTFALPVMVELQEAPV